MKISRWTAEIQPSPQLLKELFLAEGLDFKEINVPSGVKITNQRSQMTEVIFVIQGELIFNLSGTQFVLRSGDRLEMANNTLYSYSNMKNEDGQFWVGNKV